MISLRQHHARAKLYGVLPGSIAIIVAIGVAWSLAATALPLAIPSPWSVVREVYVGWNTHPYLDTYKSKGLWSALLRTLFTAISAIGVGGLLAYVWGAVMSSKETSAPSLFTEALRVMPPLVVVPVVLTFLGNRSDIGSFVVAVLYTFVGSAVFAQEAVRRVNQRQHWADLARLLNLGMFRRMLLLHFSAPLDSYLAGLRIVSGLAVGVIVVVEYFQDYGLGIVIYAGQSKNSHVTVFASILLAAVVVGVMDLLIRMVLVLRRWGWALERLLRSGRLGTAISYSLNAIQEMAFDWTLELVNFGISIMRRLVQHRRLTTSEALSLVLGIASVVVAVAAIYIAVYPPRQQRIALAWSMLNGADGKPGDAGRRQALVDLTKHNQLLRASRLNGAVLKDMALQDADLRLANMECAVLENCVFTNCDLRDVDLRSTSLVNVTFDRCALEGANFSGAIRISNVKFVLSRTAQDALAVARMRFDAVQLLDRLTIEIQDEISPGPRSRFDFGGSRFDAIRAGGGIHLAGVNLRGVDFSGSVLPDSVFRTSRLGRETSFRNAKLDRCDFSNCEIDGTDFSGADLSGCTFSNSRFHSVDFTSAILHDVTFADVTGGGSQVWQDRICSIRNASIDRKRLPASFVAWALTNGATAMD